MGTETYKKKNETLMGQPGKRSMLNDKDHPVTAGVNKMVRSLIVRTVIISAAILLYLSAPRRLAAGRSAGPAGRRMGASAGGVRARRRWGRAHTRRDETAFG